MFVLFVFSLLVDKCFIVISQNIMSVVYIIYIVLLDKPMYIV